MSAKADLEAFAKECNPVVGYWDPLGLADLPLWGQDQDAVIGWLRHSEIKHGRIAMAGFVGYIAHANGFRFGGIGPQNVVPEGASAPEVWDSIPFLAKLQIIGAIGVLEHISEDKNFLAADGMKAPSPPQLSASRRLQPRGSFRAACGRRRRELIPCPPPSPPRPQHYMRGGKPGYFPTFSANVHPMPLNLFDPFKWSKNASPEKKAKGLVTETNNGRLAMLGLFGFLSESKIPGSVPALSGIIPSYDGDYMQPFLPTGPDTSLWTIGNLWAN